MKRITSSIILLPVVVFIIIKGSFYFNVLIFLGFLISVFEWNEMTRSKRNKILGILFLILSFFTIYKIRNSFNGDYFYLLFITFICVATDVGGYLFGKLIKGPKLTKLSPNKTYSGMIGSFILPIILIYIFSKIIYFKYSYNLNLGVIFFIIIISTVSQFGDIVISYFKRVSKIKDTGKIIPGHGGLLDRIDGMIFAYPFSYLIISTINIDFY